MVSQRRRAPNAVCRVDCNIDIFLNSSATNTNSANEIPFRAENWLPTTEHNCPAIGLLNAVDITPGLRPVEKGAIWDAIVEDHRLGLLLANIDTTKERVVHVYEADEKGRRVEDGDVLLDARNTTSWLVWSATRRCRHSNRHYPISIDLLIPALRAVNACA